MFYAWNHTSLLFLPGFKLKDFLRDNETLSHFLHHNASLPRHALKQIVEADVNLEKVFYFTFFVCFSLLLNTSSVFNKTPPLNTHLIIQHFIVSILLLWHFSIFHWINPYKIEMYSKLLQSFAGRSFYSTISAVYYYTAYSFLTLLWECLLWHS